MKIPYALTAATKVPRRHEQMAHAIAQGFPRLAAVPIQEGRSLSIACYGPSLEETWRDLTRPILSMSGATRFLADRGVVVDYHVDMDPRPYKAKHLEPPVDGVHYLMASVCPPETWEILKGQRVTLWHTFSGRSEDGQDTYDWVARNDRPGELVVHGGSTIGLTAVHIGGLLGYRHFEIHGMDGSFAGDERHAGVHFGNKQNDGTIWKAEGVTYRTSKIMANAVAETINTAKNFPIFSVFHGSGLTQALIREAQLPNACTAGEKDRAATVRAAKARFVDMPRAQMEQGIRSFWDALLAQPENPRALSDVMAIAREAESRRAKAGYNTGTVPIETALLLRLMCAWYRPKVVVEVGTFIGTSTLALQASEHLYTCDRDNDCLPSTDRITCHPGQTSSAMLQALCERGVKVDLFFFDGRLQPGDVNRVMQLSHARTVYAFDDFIGKEKGVINLGKMATMLPNHVIAEPYVAFKDRTTLAALVPLVEA